MDIGGEFFQDAHGDTAGGFDILGAVRLGDGTGV